MERGMRIVAGMNMLINEPGGGGDPYFRGTTITGCLELMFLFPSQKVFFQRKPFEPKEFSDQNVFCEFGRICMINILIWKNLCIEKPF